jgi:hypothetical protein
MKEKILILHMKVSRVAAQEDHTMVAPLPQVQMGLAVEEPPIAVHIVGLNPLDALTVSSATVATSLGHGASRVPIAGVLPSASIAPYHLALPYFLL